MPPLRTKRVMNLTANLAANFALAAALCLMSGVLMSCAQQPSILADTSKDYTALSGKLAKDMTEKAVADTLGGTPDKADLTTCTDHAGKQWQCRTWIFAGGSKPKNNLRVVFYQADDGSWRVAAWDMF
jgi:hypothetical protein